MVVGLGLGVFAASGPGPTASLQAQETAAVSDAGVRLVDGGGQRWFTGRQVRDPVVLEVPGVDAAACEAATVEFTATAGGDVSPAVAHATWRDGRCVAETRWQLGSVVGRQHLQARRAGASGALLVEADGRQGARVFFGGGYTPYETGFTALAEDGTLVEQEGSGIFRPIIGVDFALWPDWTRVRAAVGASARELDRHFYFGLSGLQAFVFGPLQEGAAVDVHVGVQLSRRDVGAQGARCAPNPTCSVRALHFGGLAFLVTVDGASAFRGLAGAVLR